MPILLYAKFNESETDKEGNRVAVQNSRIVGEVNKTELDNDILNQLATKGRSLWGVSNFDSFEIKMVSKEELWAINANRLLNKEKPIQKVSPYDIIGKIDRKLESEKRKLFVDDENDNC